MDIIVCEFYKDYAGVVEQEFFLSEDSADSWLARKAEENGLSMGDLVFGSEMVELHTVDGSFRVY